MELVLFWSGVAIIFCIARSLLTAVTTHQILYFSIWAFIFFASFRIEYIRLESYFIHEHFKAIRKFFVWFEVVLSFIIFYIMCADLIIGKLSGGVVVPYDDGSSGIIFPNWYTHLAGIILAIAGISALVACPAIVKLNFDKEEKRVEKNNEYLSKRSGA